MEKDGRVCEVCKRNYYKDDVDNNGFEFQFEPYLVGFSDTLRDKNQFCINICSDECYNIKAIDEQIYIYETQIMYHLVNRDSLSGTIYDTKLAKEMNEKIKELRKLQKILYELADDPLVVLNGHVTIT